MKDFQFAAAAAFWMSFVASSLFAQDPLASWGSRTAPGVTADLYAIAYGNGSFIAVGDQSTVIRSTNGTDWATVSIDGYGNLRRVRFLNGQFWAVGTSDKLLSSPNGIDWQSSTLPTANFWDIAAGAGVYVLAGDLTFVSSNAVDWVRTYPMLPRISLLGPYETPLDTVVYGSGIFFAMATGGLSPITSVYRPPLISTNGIDWIPLLSPTAWMAFTFSPGTGDAIINNDLVLGVSRDGTFASTNRAASWCCTARALEQKHASLAFGQGTYVWISHADSYVRRLTIYQSTDGIIWPTAAVMTNDLPFLGVEFGAGTFVAVGSGGQILQSGNIGGFPSIITQPQDRAAVVGNPVSFSVEATGAAPLSFQWFSGTTSIGNATNSSYTITNTTTDHAGGYSVVVSNSFGSVTSRVAHLTIAFLDIKAYAGITILGVSGKTYRIEATPANGPVNWQTLTNLVLPASPHVWIDFDSPNVGQRLYRAAELP